MPKMSYTSPELNTVVLKDIQKRLEDHNDQTDSTNETLRRIETHLALGSDENLEAGEGDR